MRVKGRNILINNEQKLPKFDGRHDSVQPRSSTSTKIQAKNFE